MDTSCVRQIDKQLAGSKHTDSPSILLHERHKRRQLTRCPASRPAALLDCFAARAAAPLAALPAAAHPAPRPRPWPVWWPSAQTGPVGTQARRALRRHSWSCLRRGLQQGGRRRGRLTRSVPGAAVSVLQGATSHTCQAGLSHLSEWGQALFSSAFLGRHVAGPPRCGAGATPNCCPAGSPLKSPRLSSLQRRPALSERFRPLALRSHRETSPCLNRAQQHSPLVFLERAPTNWPSHAIETNPPRAQVALLTRTG